ncbi:DciA family protein [Tessaracoccus sp. OS52]|uniref:DUF721 domain-containing protein n=1 Tax=Tessaracoccus sp. OS52 TaxID=2886691 RepID=UPI001D1228F9|nr:DciA family protein [Tessaracoccus sp. OS52]MCC2593806.1 DciA family protein [Tessaracoccus sp. OS52]
MTEPHDDFEEPVEHDPTGLDLASQIARQTAFTEALPPVPVQRKPRRQFRSRFFEEQRSGARPDDRDPQPLGSVLGQVGAKRGWQKRISLSTVLQGWAALVGEDNAEHSKPVLFEEGVLTVVCDSTAWATGMRYSASKLVARLNAELGDQTVKRVDVRGPNAPSWKKGLRSVRDGRGPRDTYG